MTQVGAVLAGGASSDTDLLSDPKSEKSQQAFEAMLQMKKIDLALERASHAQPAGAR